MEELTGQRDMDARGLLDYFSPLADWLERENRQSGEHIGWEHTKKRKDVATVQHDILRHDDCSVCS
jgi:peptidyl-dipeptidase A